tara:strand:- start:15 stop:365 length:351 start_codon:yes stop_codon:yes gene_type:complete
MNPAKANLVNSLCLIGVGLWGYFSVSSPTAFIPVGFGVLLLLCYRVILKKPELNKLVSHIAVTLTLIILAALVGVRLPKALDSGGSSLVRAIMMITTSVYAMLAFIKSFIDARRHS